MRFTNRGTGQHSRPIYDRSGGGVFFSASSQSLQTGPVVQGLRTIACFRVSAPGCFSGLITPTGLVSLIYCWQNTNSGILKWKPDLRVTKLDGLTGFFANTEANDIQYNATVDGNDPNTILTAISYIV